MTLSLRVLGDRVLVRPDVNDNAPIQTATGVYLAKTLAAAVTGEDPTSSVHRGTVVESGGHAELLAADGHYARLYARQFREEAHHP